ncbi:hypothetical protein C9374_009681 [Naegleria lovaniensis]|uniref:Cation-transporting P-type ATPase N-terminal domain-containing protein n=1 Tax=Naegleria lovaniensis TaxID=51637 RepID=A0AA88GYV3_NAELO|nr:uncharacterized protein C9374_009681 [Naegleria lovaniensis]KAG2393104.1 hypothetical protein C9374_009681 [Naegleria lovaniensis]
MAKDTEQALGNEFDIDEAAKLLPEEVVEIFETDITYGLSESEARRRQAVVGLNELKEEEEESLLTKFIEKFKEPMILLLLGSAAISLLLGQYDDAISISLAVFIVCTVAFVQEWRSDKALESLKELTTHKATVIRDGTHHIIEAIHVVPGDIVTFSSGDRIPADVRLIEVARLGIDESVFTGEVNPASKDTEKTYPKHAANEDSTSSPFPKATHVADCKNIAFMGTLVAAGSGKGVVVSIGQKTEIGKISDLLKSIAEKNTPLQDAMDDLSQKISYLSFGVIGVIFLIGVFTGKPWLEMLQMGISLAVAAIPEGLPIVVTVTLAMGVIRMSKKKAIVKKLPSVESLGACNVVCVDKTGTLTKNEMTMVKAFTLAEPDIVYDVTGLGYQASEGSYYRVPISSLQNRHDRSHNGERIIPTEVPHLNTLLKIGVVCNNANVDFTTNKLVGQPTEGALITAAQKAGINVSELRPKFKKIEEIPFGSEHKWMAVRSKNIESGKELYYIKGASENILMNCTHYCVGTEYQKKPLTDQLRKQIEDANSTFAENALRVMALAVGEKSNADLTFVGIVGIYDPPRPGVKEAVKLLTKGGVRVVMITGDSMKTAVAIAKELNIVPENGDEKEYALSVDDLTTKNFEEKIVNARVFYRMAPVHKMKIVSAYQHLHYIVAMTGDGINDAPALKMANIGIAMGKSGTDVSREASEMILADDNFPTILSAIEEGKGIFNNIKSFLRYQLTTSISCMIIIIFCTFMGYPLPLNPMQILFINIIMDGPPAQSLGVEPVDDDVMNQPPRDTKKPITSGKIVISILISAIIMVIGTLYVFITEMTEDGIVTAHTTSMTFTTFVFFQVFNAFNCRSEKKSLFQVGLFTNIPLLLAVGGSALGQLALIYVPFMRAIFETEPLSLSELIFVLSVASSVWVIEEVIKFFERKTDRS